MDNFQKTFNVFRRTRFFKYGIPFFCMIVGGSFCFEQFSKIKFQYGRQSSLLVPEDLIKEGLSVKPVGSVTLESEYEKMKKLDIDNWEQIRVPRPWNEEEDEG